MVKSLATALMLFVTSLAGFAAAQSVTLDEVAKRPGTEVLKRSPDGSKVIAIRRGGVTLELTDSGGMLGIDNSGHGAVLCTWELFVSAKAAADVCFPGEFPELSNLGKEIDELDNFIIANSLAPTTKADLQAGYDEGDACRSIRPNFLEPFEKHLRSTPRAEFERDFKASLAVPRPPVMNPCL